METVPVIFSSVSASEETGAEEGSALDALELGAEELSGVEEEALSPELADAFIEKVLVDKNHNIEVVFKFQDEINMLCMRKAS